MTTALRMTLTSMVSFMILFYIVRVSFAIFLRDVDLVTALISLETWIPILIAGAFYGLIMYFVNARRYPEQ